MPDDESELTRRLSRLADTAARTARLRDARQLRKAAQRRTVGTLATAVAASAVTVMGAQAWLGGGVDDRGLPPASATTAPTTTPSSSPTSTPTDTSTPKEGWITTMPSDFRLPNEGAERWDPNRDDKGTWLLRPCLGEHGQEIAGYPSDEARTDWRSLSLDDDPEYLEYIAFEQFGFYPDAATAESAMQQMRDALTACATQSATGRDGSRRDSSWASEPARFGRSGAQPSDAFHAYNWNSYYDANGSPYGLGGPFITVIRVGNAILLVGYDGETYWRSPSAVDLAVRNVTTELRTYLPQLCIFGPDGRCER